MQFKKFRLAIGVASAVLAAVAALPAQAALVFISDAANGASNRTAASSIMTRFTTSAPVTLSSIGVEMDLASAGHLNFVIFNSLTGALLFQSGSEAFADNGMTFKVSDPLSFTLLPGTTYALGAMADVAAIQNYVVPGGKTMGSITSLGSNQNATGFLSPAFDANLAGTDARVELFAGAAVPEPTSLWLLGMGLVAAGVARRKAA